MKVYSVLIYKMTNCPIRRFGCYCYPSSRKFLKIILVTDKLHKKTGDTNANQDVQTT